MRVLAGGARTVNGEMEQIPIFKPYVLTEEDIGPNVPEKWQERIQVGKQMEFRYKGSEVPFYGLQGGQTAKDVRGKALGKRELSHRLGWWKEGMTEKGKIATAYAALVPPRKFQHGDLVARSELIEGSDDRCFQLYKVIEVPL